MKRNHNEYVTAISIITRCCRPKQTEAFKIVLDNHKNIKLLFRVIHVSKTKMIDMRTKIRFPRAASNTIGFKCLYFF